MKKRGGGSGRPRRSAKRRGRSEAAETTQWRVTLTRAEVNALARHTDEDDPRYMCSAIHVQRVSGRTVSTATSGRTLLRVSRREEGQDALALYAKARDVVAAARQIKGKAARRGGRGELVVLLVAESGEATALAAAVPSGMLAATEFPEGSSAVALETRPPPDFDSAIPDLVRDADQYVRVTLDARLLEAAARSLREVCGEGPFNPAVQLHVLRDPVTARHAPVVLTAKHPDADVTACGVVMPMRGVDREDGSQAVVGGPFTEATTVRSARESARSRMREVAAQRRAAV